jgi:hypothetical protein
MIEGLWSVTFSTPEGVAGSGVAVFESQRIFGGDSMYYYLGHYAVANAEVQGTVEVIHYAGPPWNVLGQLERITLSFRGALKEGSFSTAASDPTGQAHLGMVFSRLANLP